jgi:DNA replication licensing factor MCM5
MIFIVRDIRDEEKDQRIARHVLNVHMNVAHASAMSERRLVGRELIEADDLDIDFFRRYISYCKAKCAPRISTEAAKTLENYFVRIRSEMRDRTRDTRMAGIRAIPVTVRQLEAIVRISEALAKMRLSRVATEEHVAEAIRLFRASTMEAANSGMLQVDEYLPPEVRMEVQRAEAAISRMIEVGGTASTRSVVDALRRQGFRDFSCQKALYAMSARNDIEYRNQKRLFVRKK